MIVKILDPFGQTPVLLIRLLVGCVFLSEGIQKFLFPDYVGAGRFARIGIPEPEFTALFVASFEIMCGLLLILGLLTRLAVIPIIVIMLTAIATTKIPTLLASGFWKMAHDARTDFSMLTCSVFLLFSGGGRYSVDRIILERFRRG
jgi:putative oxidoreductase